MINSEFNIKQIIREALTEDFTRENNKVFSLSNQTTSNYITVQNYITFFRQKNKEEFFSILSDDIVLYSCGKQFVEKNNVVEQLNSIVHSFNPDEYPIEEVNLSTKLLMSTAGSFPGEYNCCPDSENAENYLYVVPWSHAFSSTVILKFNNIDFLLHSNHILKFDDHGKINNIILYTM